MDYPIIFDILDTLLVIATAPAEKLPPPMTRQEVLTQQLYSADCETTRDGIKMTCQAAFEQDLQRAYYWEDTKNGK